MNYQDVLDEYMEILDCNNKELAKYSNLSSTVISRYRNGLRTPKYNSVQYKNIIKSLSLIAKEKNIKLNDIKSKFMSVYSNEGINYDIFKNNFNILIEILNINVSDLSKYIGFDSSYISKIRNGIRKPQNINDFINSICKYIVNNYNDENYLDIIAKLINCSNDELVNSSKYIDLLGLWLCNNDNSNMDTVDSFLTKLDLFDLNEYIKDTKFDKLKVPTMPINISKSKSYYGLNGFKNSQIDALKSMVLSKSGEDIFFYSNMPMMDASKDNDFIKKFMFGVALLLKKGIHLNMVHNLNRPFKEIMLGLEGWIPLYMTGLISPYYFKNNNYGLLSNIICTSGTVSLFGNGIIGNIHKSNYYVTSKKEEVSYYKSISQYLLKKADSLMDIYNEEKKVKFNKFIDSITGNIRNINSSLPIYTISDELLNNILNNNNIDDNDKLEIINYVNKEKLRIKNTLKNNTILDEISIINEKDFNNNNFYLSLSKMFYNKKIIYTYNDYKEHIKLIKEYKKNNKNYSYKVNNDYIFKNINISIIDKKIVIISKENNPNIHFIIHHPVLVNAIDNFEVLI